MLRFKLMKLLKILRLLWSDNLLIISEKGVFVHGDPEGLAGCIEEACKQNRTLKMIIETAIKDQSTVIEDMQKMMEMLKQIEKIKNGS